jgi:hypothetical protein
MASLKPASFEPVPPDTVEDRWIDFGDGLETTPACSADAVSVAVAKDTVLPRKANCTPTANSTTPKPSTGEKIKTWLNHLIH